jgi:hypothetical protein
VRPKKDVKRDAPLPDSARLDSKQPPPPGPDTGSDLPFNFIVKKNDADRQLARKGFRGNHNAS